MTNESVITSTSINNSDYSLQLNRWFLKPIGVWPLSSTTPRLERIASVTLNILCYGFVLFAIVPSLLQMILSDENLYTKIKMLGPVSHWMVSCVNYTALLTRSKEIRHCVEHIQADWQMVTRESDQQLMLRNARFGRYVAAWCMIFMQGSVLFFCFVAAFATEIIQVGNETRIIHVLPCAVYKKLVNVDESPMNEIFLFVQISSAFIATFSTVGIFSFSAVLAAHACGQLNVVMLWITEYVNDSRDKKAGTLNKIGVIVEQHLRTLKFISFIEEVLNRIYFLELFRCTMDICILSYYILAEWVDHDIKNLATYFFILISILFNIFILCYMGEILSEKSKKVGEAVYMTNWYHLPERSILDLILIITRSSVVVHITAGKFIRMSIYTFGDVVRTGFAYLNLLRRIS
ncbi:PREDICTED: odorant receptor 4-like [Eufriesea mexicana]|uniref:odorant receptor 4-like n=1 Tax=Eufriesea mexicana TaxID=516756 RepID=UPI00083C5C13|nr:PREDICTED: odorant receptor 4-like [Eufriesea mexicana]